MSIDFEAAPKVVARAWPGAGAIDLSIHDLPHDSSTMEWWYVNCHVASADGRSFSIFAAFFRVDVSAADDTERTFSHFLTWALVDTINGTYHPHTLVDRLTPRIALDELEKRAGSHDDRLTRALREVLEKGVVPLPDLMMQRDAIVALDTLSLDLDGNQFRKLHDGSYHVVLGDEQSVACRMRFTLDKPVVRHGDDGVVRGREGEDMFYYFSPRCRVNGEVFVGDRWQSVSGDGWYDHEFGESRQGSSRGEATVGWNWVSAQLDNGCEISAYALAEREPPYRSCGRWVIVIGPEGERTAYTDFTFEPYGRWTSTKTFNEYPIGYRLEVPHASISLDVKAALPGQEVVT
jgi:predicted secreted hydrolase